MDEAFVRQLEILKADGATVKILTDEEAAFWQKTTHYEGIQEKYTAEHSEAGEVLEAIRRFMK